MCSHRRTVFPSEALKIWGKRHLLILNPNNSKIPLRICLNFNTWLNMKLRFPTKPNNLVKVAQGIHLCGVFIFLKLHQHFSFWGFLPPTLHQWENGMCVCVCCALQKILPAADFLQNVVSINVQLMDEEKACIALLFVCALIQSVRGKLLETLLLLRIWVLCGC